MSKPVTQFFHAADAARLAYLDEGEGPVVLCLSGLTRTKEDFDEAMPALKGARVVRMDYRGRGESDYTGGRSYRVTQEALDAIALLDHLNIEKAAILGTSRGGMIAMHLAATQAHRLSGICLVDIGPELQPEGLVPIRDYIGRRPAAKTLAELAEKLPLYSIGFANVAPAQWQAMAARLYHEDESGLHLRYDPALREPFLGEFRLPPDQWQDWAATAGLPVALIRGAGTTLLHPDCVARMREIRPDLRVAEVPDRGHVPFLDEPQSVALLKAWLSDLGVQSA